MTEYDLIEIAKRFRVMEDVAEVCDLVIAAAAESKNGEARYCPREYESLSEMRAAMEKATETCRADMVRMQEEIRKAAK